ncbi:uncharacterized protein LOC112505792 [Cynara cardunculus var. scolymus]|uniref:uncharacterized protein LOC112505792 n=1 Tax=Cynara cardunculus var. scolymus TaxID=59895 RepID=UPI000D6237DE|nr:uncharacterized protein LOC112505792 [Cynara cardunculus var. scolymus]
MIFTNYYLSKGRFLVVRFFTLGSSLQINRHVESLRTTSLPYPDLCARLFEGGMSMGIGVHGPSLKYPLPTTEPFVVTEEETNVSSDQVPCLQHLVHPVLRLKNKRVKKLQSTLELDEKFIKFLDSMASKYGNPELVSYDTCLKILNDLGWKKDDPLYHIFFSLLTDNRNKKPWMTIPSEIAKEWVRTVGEK